MPPNVHHNHHKAATAEVESAAWKLNDSDNTNVEEATPGDDLLSSWATVDASRLGVDDTPYAVSNLVSGRWIGSSSTNQKSETLTIIHPLDRTAPPLFTIPDTSVADDLPAYVASLRRCTKSGLHNPFKHPERYLMLGEVSRRAGNLLATTQVREFFVDLITTCVPKSRGALILLCYWVLYYCCDVLHIYMNLN